MPPMNIKTKYNKIIKALTIRQSDLWNITKLILPLENNFQTEAINDEEVCIVPTEPSFQLPNIFLKTKKNPNCQKLIDMNKSDTEWNQTIEGVLEIFDEMDFSDSKEGAKTKECPINQDILERMLCRRYGYE